MAKKVLYKIENNVPLEAIRQHIRYPFHLMNIMDSFFVKVKRNKNEDDFSYNERINLMQRVISTGARKFGKDKKTGFQVITRRNDKGIRVWRKS